MEKTRTTHTGVPITTEASYILLLYSYAIAAETRQGERQRKIEHVSAAVRLRITVRATLYSMNALHR